MCQIIKAVCPDGDCLCQVRCDGSKRFCCEAFAEHNKDAIRHLKLSANTVSGIFEACYCEVMNNTKYMAPCEEIAPSIAVLGGRKLRAIEKSMALAS